MNVTAPESVRTYQIDIPTDMVDGLEEAFVMNGPDASKNLGLVMRQAAAQTVLTRFVQETEKSMKAEFDRVVEAKRVEVAKRFRLEDGG